MQGLPLTSAAPAAPAALWQHALPRHRLKHQFSRLQGHADACAAISTDSYWKTTTGTFAHMMPSLLSKVLSYPACLRGLKDRCQGVGASRGYPGRPHLPALPPLTPQSQRALHLHPGRIVARLVPRMHCPQSRMPILCRFQALSEHVLSLDAGQGALRSQARRVCLADRLDNGGGGAARMARVRPSPTC